MANTEFSRKVVLITGASGNLGRTTNATFTKQGASLAFAGNLQEGLDAIREDGLKIQVDLTDAGFSKWVSPEALADVRVILASDAVRCITGTTIPVYGQS